MTEYIYKPTVFDRVTRTLDHYIISLFGGYRAKALDIAVLEAFRKALPDAAGEILAYQMKKFNHYGRWRSRAGSESTLGYYRAFGFKKFEPAHMLKFNILCEYPVASARIASRENYSGPTARVDLFLHSGEAESLKYDLSPQKIFGTYSPPIDEIAISDIKVLFDPMNPDPFPTSESHDSESLPDWIRSRISGCAGASMRTPLSAELREKMINYYDLPFPDDYVELVSSAEYVGCPDFFEIFGLSKIWMYMTPREYVVVLGEVFGEGYVCLVRNAAPGVYFIDHNLDHIPMNMGNSLEKALSRALDEGADAIIESSKEYNP